MRKLRMYKSALFLASWFPKGLGLDVPTTNSKCLMLRRPGMQEELRIRGTKTRNPLRLGACLCRYGRQVFAKKRGFPAWPEDRSREWGIGGCHTRNRAFSCFPGFLRKRRACFTRAGQFRCSLAGSPHQIAKNLPFSLWQNAVHFRSEVRLASAN